MDKCKICGHVAEHANRVNSFIENGEIDIETLTNLANFYKIMGDPTRLKILITLIEEPKSVGVVANKLNMTISAISHQLRVLKDAKLVKANKIGKEVFYELDDSHIKLILDMGIDHIKEE